MPIARRLNPIERRGAIRAGVIDVAGGGHVVAVALRGGVENAAERQRQQTVLNSQCIDSLENVVNRIRLRRRQIDRYSEQRDDHENVDDFENS